MKKSILFGLALAGLVLPLAGCGSSESKNSDATLKEKKTYSVYVKTPDKADTTLDICYFSDNPDIGYISLANGFTLYKQLRGDYYNDADWDYKLSTESNEKGAVVQRVTNVDNNTYFELDAGNDSATFSSVEGFIVENGNVPGAPVSSYGTYPDQDSTSIDLIAWGNAPSIYGNYEQKLGPEGKTFDLKKYDILVQSYQDEAYLPFATFSDLFLGRLYTPLSICKNGIYGVTEYKAMADAIKNQGLDITDDLLKFNYHEICFNFDNFYGFAEERVGRDFASYFKRNGFEDLFLKSANGADTALNNVICTLMDDGHTNFLAVSPSDTETFNQVFGMKMATSLTKRLQISKLRQEAYPDGIPAYEEIGNTAVITFDRFDEEPKDLYTTGVPATLEATQGNAVALFAYAYSQINREGSPIENVIVDDSYNGGGDVKCAAYIGGMLCGGDVNFYTRNTVTDIQTASCIVADANLDGKYDANDTLMSSKNIYVLTSTFSFSCGNFLPSLIKQNVKGHVFGQRSGGGSNVVLMGSTAIGTAYRMSGITQLCSWKNATYTSIDDGVEVDMPVLPDRMYSNDRADLLSDLGLK